MTYPRRPVRDLQVPVGLRNERISSPDRSIFRKLAAGLPTRRTTASGDERRELIQLDGGVFSGLGNGASADIRISSSKASAEMPGDRALGGGVCGV
jgi:hypothetical protein